MKKLIKALRYYYPFTLPGNLLFYFSIFSLGRGFASLNFTAISVSLFFLVFILAIYGWLFFCSRSRSFERIVWKSEGSVDSAGNNSNRQIINIDGSGISGEGVKSGKRTFPFLRYSIIIKGHAVIAGGISTFFSRRYRSNNKGVFDFSFYFPYPGTVSGNVTLYLEDIFSLTRIKVFNENLKNFTVVPGIKDDAVTDSRFLVKDIITKQRKYDNDIEKYLMREYVPGDLYRDINWKSSARIDKLFTRISPGGKEESNILTFLYLSGSAGNNQSDKKTVLYNAEKIFENFISGKYFREYFYTFIHRIKRDAEAGSDCEIRVFVNSEKCIVKEMSDLYKAGHLLAATASVDNSNVTDLGFLSEIPSGSNISIFAETNEILQAVLRKLSADHIHVCYLPSLIYKYGDNSKNYITCKRSSFIFSSFYKPALFYAGAAASFIRSFFSGFGRKSGAIKKHHAEKEIYTINNLAPNSIKRVEIRMSSLNSLIQKEQGGKNETI